MLLAHKIALQPNPEQRIYLTRAAGTARFAYNWALAEWPRQYREGGKPSEVALRKYANGIAFFGFSNGYARPCAQIDREQILAALKTRG